MNNIVIAKSGDLGLDQSTLHDMFRFRHKVFHDRLKWDVTCRNNMEMDLYDELKPVYIIAKSKAKTVVGCWRLLPTIGPYMLKDTFPQLLHGESAPQANNIWELSRFAVESSADGELAQANLSSVTFEMIRSAVLFADKQGISQYVTVTSVALERLLKFAGIRLRRFGDGKAERVGKVLSVACWIDVDDKLRQIVYSSTTATKHHEKAA